MTSYWKCWPYSGLQYCENRADEFLLTYLNSTSVRKTDVIQRTCQFVMLSKCTEFEVRSSPGIALLRLHAIKIEGCGQP